MSSFFRGLVDSCHQRGIAGSRRVPTLAFACLFRVLLGFFVVVFLVAVAVVVVVVVLYWVVWLLLV